MTATKPKATFRLNKLSETMLMEQVAEWTSSTAYNYYLGFGGAGDALLLLAKCWDDPQARMLFFHNTGSFCRDLFTFFDVETFLHPNIMKAPLGRIVYNYVTNLETYQPSAHLPDRLDLSEWKDTKKYAERMTLSVPWAEMIGRHDNPFQTRGIVCVCPTGGQRHASRQRYLHDFEYSKLCGKLLVQGYTVVTLDSPDNFRFYPLINHQHSIRCTASTIEMAGKKEDCGFDTMLKLVNASEYCVTVDTWLATYCNLVGVPLKVIKTRYNGAYNFDGEEMGDLIFLNKVLWPNMELLKAQEICY